MSGGVFLFGGITIDGQVFSFDRETGELYASADLSRPDPIDELEDDEPCDPEQYALLDNPMEYDFNGDGGDSLTFLGIWTTGVQPGDRRSRFGLFMNPCQIGPYLKGNTFGGGSFITNTPGATADPNRPTVSRIFICGRQSQALKEYDLDKSTEDAFLYRVDFDAAADEGERLVVMNYEIANGFSAI